ADLRVIQDSETYPLASDEQPVHEWCGEQADDGQYQVAGAEEVQQRPQPPHDHQALPWSSPVHPIMRQVPDGCQVAGSRVTTMVGQVRRRGRGRDLDAYANLPPTKTNSSKRHKSGRDRRVAPEVSYNPPSACSRSARAITKGLVARIEAERGPAC